MENIFLTYKNSRIGYCRFGSGPVNAFCFHGFGEDATSFRFLGDYAGNQYTFHAIDLPLHGKTEWNDGPTFTVYDLQQIIAQIQNVAGATSGGTTTNQQPQTNNTLIGFSLGGRIALSLYQAMPEKINRLVLLAPDGLKLNFWYWLSTQTWLGNKFFAFTMKHPGWFFGFLKGLNKMGLVNASIFKFVNYYIGDKETRQVLYKRWTVLRKLKPRLPSIKSYIAKNNTQVRLLYGRHDRIILPSIGEKFRKGVEQQSVLTVIHSGHQVLHEKHVAEILPALLD